MYAASLALLVLPGCGGGSGGGTTSLSGSTSGGRAALNVYVAGGRSSQYKQVLATLYKIEISTDGTTFQTVYSNTSGETIDLTSLSTTAELLATVQVSTGTYTQARITFGDHITTVSASGTSTSVAVDTSVGVDTNGQIAITVNTPAKVTANQSNAVTVDFNLAAFKLTGSVLQPSIQCTGNGGGMGGPGGPGGPQGMMGSAGAHLGGQVSGLSSTGFTLSGPDGRTITVTLTSTTTITDGQTGAAATLANGDNVLVQGPVDTTTGVITATSVVLSDFTPGSRSMATGTVASVDSTAGSFVLTVTQADGIQPTGGTITVTTSSTTRFSKAGNPASFSDIAVGGTVGVNGPFNSTTQTLAANCVNIN
jgi:hypothetical protein